MTTTLPFRRAVLRSPEVVERMKREGFEALVSTPADTDKMVAEEMTRWAGIIKAAGIEPN